MIIATYNMFGGMKGNTLISNAISHYYLYVKNSFKQIVERSKNLDDAKKLILDSNADILCINEVIYELQKEEMVSFLESLGYKKIIIDKSSNRNNHLDLCTILASKLDGEELNIEIPKGNKITTEGSVCSLRINQENTLVIAVHLSLSKKLRLNQLKIISEFALKEKDKNKNIILMGDFNESFKKLQAYEDFNKLNITTSQVPTYPTFPISNVLNWFKWDYDHIFHNSPNKPLSYNVKQGNSDHFMLSCNINSKDLDLETQIN